MTTDLFKIFQEVYLSEKGNPHSFKIRHHTTAPANLVPTIVCHIYHQGITIILSVRTVFCPCLSTFPLDFHLAVRTLCMLESLHRTWKVIFLAPDLFDLPGCSLNPPSTPGCVVQEWSHWPSINGNLVNLWAGAEHSYLISLRPKALAWNWLLGYLLKTDTQIQGVYLCVCSSFSGKLPSPLLACMY